uniref:N-acetyltransferase domain-containing protein n=1 Tax=Amphimedon queenslandica TaxID=400682 RepID=A0A1X7VP12_AMPQE
MSADKQSKETIPSIRPLLDSDIRAVQEVHINCIKEVCSSCYSKEDITAWIDRQSITRYQSLFREGTAIVAENEEGEVIGFGHIDKTSDEGCDHVIKGLYVSPKVIGRGVGTLLFNELKRIAVHDGCNKLLVFSSKNAVSFYERIGFIAGKCAKHCPNESDNLFCIKMIKTL